MRRSLLLALAATAAFAQTARSSVNYDETKVGDLQLPDLELTTSADWTNRRRPEILKLFEAHVFGKTPAADTGAAAYEVTATKPDALDGLATRKIIHISLPNHPAWPGMDVMLYTPNASKPAPCFVGLSFGGNHAVSMEADVPLSTRWMPETPKNHSVKHRATEASRGTQSSRWPLEMILRRGFAVATAYYGDIEPDYPDGWKDGLRAVLSPQGANTALAGRRVGRDRCLGLGPQPRSPITCKPTRRSMPDTLPCIGHSRLGKTSLWAGAQDERFGIVISNNSGEGGAALMRRNFGETTGQLTQAFPHWFTPKYSSYADNDAACPIDKHMLIALAAPRPVYIASATEDRWADPKGEFLSGLHAKPVYALFGKKGTVVENNPPPTPRSVISSAITSAPANTTSPTTTGRNT